jgi:predicted ATPase
LSRLLNFERQKLSGGVAMAKLNRIRIKGFKSIGEMDLTLSDLNVLIGANGAGKSNFISAFQLLNNIIEKTYNYMWNGQ